MSEALEESIRAFAHPGRRAGIIGPAVDMGPAPSPQARLLGAMGRTP